MGDGNVFEYKHTNVNDNCNPIAAISPLLEEKHENNQLSVQRISAVIVCANAVPINANTNHSFFNHLRLSVKSSGGGYGGRSYYRQSKRGGKDELLRTMNGAFPNIITQSTAHTFRYNVRIPSLVGNDLITTRMQMSEILSLRQSGAPNNKHLKSRKLCRQSQRFLTADSTVGLCLSGLESGFALIWM